MCVCPKCSLHASSSSSSLQHTQLFLFSLSSKLSLLRRLLPHAAFILVYMKTEKEREREKSTHTHTHKECLPYPAFAGLKLGEMSSLSLASSSSSLGPSAKAKKAGNSRAGRKKPTSVYTIMLQQQHRQRQQQLRITFILCLPGRSLCWQSLQRSAPRAKEAPTHTCKALADTAAVRTATRSREKEP